MHYPRHHLKTQEAFARAMCGEKIELKKANSQIFDVPVKNEDSSKLGIGKRKEEKGKSETNSRSRVPENSRSRGQNLNSRSRESFVDRIFRAGTSAGFIATAIFHLLLFAIAVFVLVDHFVPPKVEEPTNFVTGAGGGNGGENLRERAKRAPKSVEVKSPKIFSKSANSKIALPEIDMPKISLGNANFGEVADGFGKGIGRGNPSGSGGGNGGGGIGNGNGPGVGNGKNFVSQFKIMGVEIKAKKLAVYLDCSASMTPYLPAVKEEIYALFPDADIFEIEAISTQVFDGELVGGKRSRPSVKPAKFSVALPRDNTDANRLSIDGKKLYKKYAANFVDGSVGAWLDVMLSAPYDGLIIFSDFEDGLRQWDKNRNLLYAESRYQPKLDDERKAKDLRWLDAWEKTIKSRKGRPFVYCYTISRAPQKHFERLVELSGGEIHDVSYLRKANKKKKSKKESKKTTSSRSRKSTSKSNKKKKIDGDDDGNDGNGGDDGNDDDVPVDDADDE